MIVGSSGILGCSKKELRWKNLSQGDAGGGRSKIMEMTLSRVGRAEACVSLVAKQSGRQKFFAS
jgi:hypothetical protein